jgi:hypothetical protein
LEHCQNAVNKIKSWNFLNKECEHIRPLPSQTGWLITEAAVQHVWRRVNKERKSKYLGDPKPKLGCNSIQFISHSINPLHGINHKDVESVIEYSDIYNIQLYSWIMHKSKNLHV